MKEGSVLSKLAIRRLTKLADFMGKLRPTKKRKFSMKVVRQETSCGTRACAMGYAAELPEFKAAGFEVVDDITVYKGFTGILAAMTFFDLYDRDYDRIFTPQGFRGNRPSQWAKHCRNFITERSTK